MLSLISEKPSLASGSEVELCVKVEKLLPVAKAPWKAIIRDCSGLDILVNFRGSSPTVKAGHCYLFRVKVGAEYRGTRTFTMELTPDTCRELVDFCLEDVLTPLDGSEPSVGFHYHFRARVKSWTCRTVETSHGPSVVWNAQFIDPVSGNSYHGVYWVNAGDRRRLSLQVGETYDVYYAIWQPSSTPSYPGRFNLVYATFVVSPQQ